MQLLKEVAGGDEMAAASLMPLVESEVARHGEPFTAAAARVMREILVEHARAAAPSPKVDEVLAIDAALARLEPRLARIVELHYFGKLSIGKIAALLGLAERLVKRDWALARVRIFRLIEG